MILEKIMGLYSRLIVWVYNGLSDTQKEELKPELEQWLKFTREEKLTNASVETRLGLDDNIPED